jgi:hypothetical protein
VLDLDLVYEMLDPRREPKDDQARWKDARRTAGRIVAGLVGVRPAVVVDGELDTESERADFLEELPGGLQATFVTLAVDFDEAWRRARADPTRGVSRERAFHFAHYAARANLERNDGDLVLDTGSMSVSACAGAVADRVLRAAPRRDAP